MTGSENKFDRGHFHKSKLEETNSNQISDDDSANMFDAIE